MEISFHGSLKSTSWAIDLKCGLNVGWRVVYVRTLKEVSYSNLNRNFAHFMQFMQFTTSVQENCVHASDRSTYCLILLEIYMGAR